MPQRIPTREEIQSVLLALLVARKESSTCGVAIAALERDYRDEEGMRIPFRELGHSCLLDLLRSMSSVLSVRQRNGLNVVYPIVSEKTAHVSSLVAGQKVSHKKPRGGRRPVMRRTPWYPQVSCPPRRLDSKILGDIAGMARNRRDGMPMNEVLRYIQNRSNASFELEDLKVQLREINHEVVVERDVVYSVSSYQEPTSIKQNGTYAKNSYPTNNNCDETTEKYCEVRCSGHSDEEEDFGPMRDNAVSSIGNTNDNSNNDNYRTKITEGEPNERKNVDKGEVFHEENNNCEVDEDDENCDQKNTCMLINERTKFRLEKLIQQHPEGICCADLPDIYLKEYKLSLNYEELGFGSVSDFAAYLPDVFHAVQPEDKGDFKLFDAKAERPNLKPIERPNTQTLAALHKIYEAYGEEKELPVPTVLPNGTSQRLIPDGVMSFGETVPQISVTELNVGGKEYIDVVVVELYTPSFFWIQLLNRTPKFEQFMIDLHSFYSIHAKEYAMPIIIMEKGLNCACRYDDRWHRGLIKTVKHDNTVTVLFYDYGTVQTYEPEEIHFLHRSFSASPAQAIPCGLYNVKPKDSDKWSKLAALQLSLQVIGKPLVATIAVTDTDNNSMLIGLTNTEASEDLHINDWMVQNGFATYGKMGDTVDMNDTLYDATIYVDTTSYRCLPEGFREPPGLTLDTIIEEKENNIDTITEMRIQQMQQEMEQQFQQRMEQQLQQKLQQQQQQQLQQMQQQMQQMQQQMQAQIYEIWKDLVSESKNRGDEKSPEIPENSQFPLIPPFPKQTSSAFVSKSETPAPLVNGVDNLKDEAALADFDFSTPNPTPSIKNFDAKTKLPDKKLNDFLGEPTKCGLSPSAADYVPQTTTYPFDDFTNSGSPNASKIPTSLNSSGTSSSDTNTFAFNPRIWEPTLRKKFEGSVENSVKEFFIRTDSRLRSKVEDPLTKALPDSNPFKIDIDKNDNYTKSRKPMPPPLPPRRTAKPWDVLMQSEIPNQWNPPATKTVYEAPPVMYNTAGETTSNSKSSSSVSIKREDPVETNETKVAPSIENFFLNLSWGTNETEKRNETDEQRNLRLFNESYASERSKISNSAEVAIAKVSTNAKSTACDPPPLPPRPPKFDFHTMSADEQNRYTDWLKAAEYSDNFADDESFVNNGLKPKMEDDKVAVAGRRPVALAIRRLNTREKSIDRDDTVKTEIDAKQSIATKREVTSQVDDADPCQFKAYQMSESRTMHVFNMNNEGWLATEEFAAAFTNLHALALVNVLKRLGVHVPFRTLSRIENLRFFEKLDRTSLGVSRDENKKIGDVLHLTPLISCIKILRKLKFVSDEEIEIIKGRRVPEKSQMLYHLVMLIQEYAKFQQSLKAPSDHSAPT